MGRFRMQQHAMGRFRMQGYMFYCTPTLNIACSVTFFNSSSPLFRSPPLAAPSSSTACTALGSANVLMNRRPSSDVIISRPCWPKSWKRWWEVKVQNVGYRWVKEWACNQLTCHHQVLHFSNTLNSQSGTALSPPCCCWSPPSPLLSPITVFI